MYFFLLLSLAFAQVLELCVCVVSVLQYILLNVFFPWQVLKLMHAELLMAGEKNIFSLFCVQVSIMSNMGYCRVIVWIIFSAVTHTCCLLVVWCLPLFLVFVCYAFKQVNFRQQITKTCIDWFYSIYWLILLIIYLSICPGLLLPDQLWHPSIFFFLLTQHKNMGHILHVFLFNLI